MNETMLKWKKEFEEEQERLVIDIKENIAKNAKKGFVILKEKILSEQTINMLKLEGLNIDIYVSSEDGTETYNIHWYDYKCVPGKITRVNKG